MNWIFKLKKMEQSDIKKMKRRKPFFLLFFIAGLFLISAVVMMLWNAILPSLTDFCNDNLLAGHGLVCAQPDFIRKLSLRFTIQSSTPLFPG
jgi:multisubunit Na+/H+ antiporter MnhB subunit